jgi:hypothetical protein
MQAAKILTNIGALRGEYAGAGGTGARNGDEVTMSCIVKATDLRLG